MRLNRKQIIVTGYVFHLIAAIFSLGYHHCDELFQIYEFAGFKSGVNSASEMHWEFHERMRSGLQPFIVFCVNAVFHSAHIVNPFYVALVIRLFQSSLSFLAVCLFMRLFETEIREEKHRNWFWFLGLLTWCMPYFHARFSSENFSATLFLFGLFLLLRPLKNNLPGLFFGGVLLGLAFISRFQAGFMIAGLMGWCFYTKRFRSNEILTLIAGGIAALGLGFLLDRWLYGVWTCSWWNYLDLNLFQDRASAFGREPWYYYLAEATLQLIPPFSVLVIIALFVFWIKKRTHVITWITVPFIVLHVFVAHKELRFLFPVLSFLPFVVMHLVQDIRASEENRPRWQKLFIGFFLFVNTVLLLVVLFKPADNISHMLKKVYDLTATEAAVMYFEQADPYDKAAALHFFHNPGLVTRHISDTAQVKPDVRSFYFSERYGEGPVIFKNGKVFTRVYTNFPSWFSYINVNNWLSRAYSFSVYRENKSGSNL